MKNEALATVQASPGLTEQNSHSDNLEALAMAAAFGILVVLAVAAWMSWKQLFGTRSSEKSTEPTSKMPLY
jgi:heme/copper-type cytochrome/quinol oxidase subunit 2